jgi:hypothetical protein
MKVSRKVRKQCRPSGVAVVAIKPISTGDVVLSICGHLCRRPSRHTLQVSGDLHVHSAGRLWGFINHSCDPNCRIDFVHWRIVAARPIAAGDEIGLNYLTTEWDMASPFACHCGAAACLGRIAGLRHLHPEQAHHLRSLVAPHLLRKLRRAAARRAVQQV